MLAIGNGVLLFLLTSFSDPGTVNSANVSDYLSAYPYDKVIYVEKECRTCKIPKFVLFYWSHGSCCICFRSFLAERSCISMQAC